MSTATQATPEQVPPHFGLLQVFQDFWKSRAIFAFAKLGLADHIAAGADTVEALADATSTHAPSMYRLLRALSSAGFIEHDGNGRYKLTPVSDTLRSDAPVSMRASAISELGEDHYEAWGELTHSVQTGEIAFDKRYGQPVFDYYTANSETNLLFAESMTNLSKLVMPTVLEAYDFSPYKLAVDVGGGLGSTLCQILKATPGLKGIVTDSPALTNASHDFLASQELAHCCVFQPCNFFESVPAGGDLYIMKWILHDWNDAQCETILKNTHAAMVDGGTIVAIDSVVPDTDEPNISKWVDLNMLVMVGGRERTAREFKDLYARAGFDLTRIIPTASGMSLIEGKKVTA